MAVVQAIFKFIASIPIFAWPPWPAKPPRSIRRCARAFRLALDGVYADDDDQVVQWPVLLSFISSVLMVAGALHYYLRGAKAQRDRLAAMDRDDAAVRSSLI